MSTYIVITAEVNGVIKTGLVLKDDDDSEINAADYFVGSAKNVTVEGEVTIEGPAMDMIPDDLVEG